MGKKTMLLQIHKIDTSNPMTLCVI